ncbi:MAG TPA: PAS domain S-box protein [Verrucomicrobiota bacterium]|nr:PAS domain S-box protein [Verrucomicrobiota bacterium]
MSAARIATSGSPAVSPAEAFGPNGHVEQVTRTNILLVDDRPDKLLAMEAILAPLNQNIVKARSGKDALRELLRRDFAVILLDVAMPGMDGFETAAMIRRRPRSEHTPIIFVTSISNSENSVFQGYSLGAVDYIVTPIMPEVLRTKVSVFVELHRKSEVIREQAERLRQAEAARHQRELAEAADRLDTETRRNRFFTLALDLLGIADFNGYLLQINPAWEKALGYTEEELKARSGLELAHPDDREAMRQQFERLKRDGLPVYFEARYEHKDGSWRWLGWTAAPFASEHLIYIFARDITSRKAAEEEIRSLNAELSRRINDLTEINKELESFSYSISHDLRAPLRSIASFTQVVLSVGDKGLSSECRDYLRRVESAAKYMDKLLMDLLDYSRLSRSEMELGPVNLETAVTEVLFSIDQEIQSRQARIEVVRPLSCVRGHPATVRQVLFNLIANGLKFVKPGGVPEIQIWSEERNGWVRVFIADQGIGIASQFQRKIFGLFQRLHSQSSYPGTGVGLAMVQKGVERMGGRIGVESEPGKGSRFWFMLPQAEAADQLEFARELQKA